MSGFVHTFLKTTCVFHHKSHASNEAFCFTSFLGNHTRIDKYCQYWPDEKNAEREHNNDKETDYRMDKLENKAFLNASFGIRYFEIRHIMQNSYHNIKCQVDNGIKISLNMLCRLVMLTLQFFVLDFRAGVGVAWLIVHKTTTNLTSYATFYRAQNLSTPSLRLLIGSFRYGSYL